MTTFSLGYPVPVRLKQILELHRERDEATTSLQLFKEMRAAAARNYSPARGQQYYIELSAWCEDFRAEIETCINYLIANRDEYWNDSYDHLYPHVDTILRKHLVRSRQRKLALLVA